LSASSWRILGQTRIRIGLSKNTTKTGSPSAQNPALCSKYVVDNADHGRRPFNKADQMLLVRTPVHEATSARRVCLTHLLCGILVYAKNFVLCGLLGAAVGWFGPACLWLIRKISHYVQFLFVRRRRCSCGELGSMPGGDEPRGCPVPGARVGTRPPPSARQEHGHTELENHRGSRRLALLGLREN